MNVFTAALIAASASALAVTETYEFINEDANVNLYDPTVTWSGQYMTLTTTVDGDEIEFCLNAIVPGAADDSSSSFGVWWYDGVEYSATNYDLEADGVRFGGSNLSGSWLNGVYDFMFNADSLEEASQDWTLTSDSRTCDEDDTCEFDYCATRALVTGDSEDFDLPFKEGSSIWASLTAGGVSMTVLTGAMSLGLALFSAAGAALTLM